MGSWHEARDKKTATATMSTDSKGKDDFNVSVMAMAASWMLKAEALH